MIPSGDEHGRIAATLAFLVERHVRECGPGLVHGAETGFILARDPDTVRAPALAFTRAERERASSGMRSNSRAAACCGDSACASASCFRNAGSSPAAACDYAFSRQISKFRAVASVSQSR